MQSKRGEANENAASSLVLLGYSAHFAAHFVYNMPSLWRIKTICNFENANEKMPMKLIF